MSEITPSLLLPDAPPEGGALRNKFDAMLLDTSDVINYVFPDNWGIDDTENALALSGVDDVLLKDCIVDASASVWGVTMRPAQLEACFHILHPHCPNSLVVVHRTGGGEDSHPTNSWCDRKGDRFDFYPAAHSLGRRDA